MIVIAKSYLDLSLFALLLILPLCVSGLRTCGGREKERERAVDRQNWITAQEDHQTAGSHTHTHTYTHSHTLTRTQNFKKTQQTETDSTLCPSHRKIIKQQATARTHHKLISYTHR